MSSHGVLNSLQWTRIIVCMTISRYCRYKLYVCGSEKKKNNKHIFFVSLCLLKCYKVFELIGLDTCFSGKWLYWEYSGWQSLARTVAHIGSQESQIKLLSDLITSSHANPGLWEAVNSVKMGLIKCGPNYV